VRVLFSETGWGDYLLWHKRDPKLLGRINELIEDIRRSPFRGIGKPEPLRGDLSGFWSRRITGEQRLVYAVEGRPGTDQTVIIAMCGQHY